MRLVLSKPGFAIVRRGEGIGDRQVPLSLVELVVTIPVQVIMACDFAIVLV